MSVTPTEKGFVGHFEREHQRYRVDLSSVTGRDLTDVSHSVAQRAMKSLVHCLENIDVFQVNKITAKGIELNDGSLLAHKGGGWTDFTQRLAADQNRQVGFTPSWGEVGHQVKYQDPHWKTNLTFIPADPLFQSLQKSCSPQSFPNLEELCSAVEGKIPGDVKVPTPSGILLSTKRREDYEYSGQLKGNEDAPIYQCRYLKNGLNGLTYQKDGKPVTIDSAVTSSLFREASELHLGRRYTDEEDKTVCYAGRPNTLQKAKELVEMIFLSELDPNTGTGKGINKLIENGKPVYEFRFCVQSLLSSSSITIKDLKRIGQIIDAFNELAAKDIDIDGHRVRCIPMFFTDQFNGWNRMEEALHPSFNGKKESEEISSLHGQKGLLQLIDSKLGTLKKDDPLYSEILDTLELLNGAKLPEERILCRAYLLKILNIPLTLHCQSSVDRTSVGVAVVLAADQWMKSHPLPRREGKLCITDLLQKDEFKELFAAHLHPGLITAEYSRGEKGLKLQAGMFQNEQILRLLPARYLRDFSIGDLPWRLGALSGLALVSARLGNQGLQRSKEAWVEASDNGAIQLLKRCLLLIGEAWGFLLAAIFTLPFVQSYEKLFPEKQLDLSSEDIAEPLLNHDQNSLKT